MPTEEDINDQQELLLAHRRTLHHYLLQQAELGKAYVPPGVSNGILEERAIILHLKETLRGWNLVVEDLPDDEDYWKNAVIESTNEVNDRSLDKQLFLSLRKVFNRPAFRGTFLWQTNPVPFKQAVDLTIAALGTGEVARRSGKVVYRIEGMEQVADRETLIKLDEVITRLKTISNLIAQHPVYQSEGQPPMSHIDNERQTEIRLRIDDERDNVIVIINSLLAKYDIPLLPIPTQVTDSTDVWEQFA